MDSNAETALLELNGKFERMMDNIEIVKDKQEQMAEDIAKILVYTPELENLKGLRGRFQKFCGLL